MNNNSPPGHEPYPTAATDRQYQSTGMEPEHRLVIAQILDRAILHSEKITGATFEELRALRDRFATPPPSPGTLVWWQDEDGLGDPVLGRVNYRGKIEMFGTAREIDADSVKWWPADIKVCMCSEDTCVYK